MKTKNTLPLPIKLFLAIIFTTSVALACKVTGTKENACGGGSGTSYLISCGNGNLGQCDYLETPGSVDDCADGAPGDLGAQGCKLELQECSWTVTYSDCSCHTPPPLNRSKNVDAQVPDSSNPCPLFAVTLF